MKRLVIAAVATAAAALVPAAAQAQSFQGAYAGIQGGYHDFAGSDGALIGGYLGYNFPVGETFVLGLEGNANLGTNAIDAEYGVNANLGVRVGNGQIFGRVGWQQIEFDGPFKGDDVMYGIGGEFGINERTAFRVVVDTLDFHTTRLTGGVTFRF